MVIKAHRMFLVSLGSSPRTSAASLFRFWVKQNTKSSIIHSVALVPSSQFARKWTRYLFLLKRAKRTCPQKISTLSRVSFLTRSHFVRFLSLGLVLISEKNNNTLVVYMTIFFRSEANSFPGSVRFRGKEREGLWVRVCFVTTNAFVTLRNRLYKKQNVRMRM